MGYSVSSSEERKARSFVERHGLWNDEQFEAAALADKRIEDEGRDTVRLSFPDQHGILRGKAVVATQAAAAMRNGCAITTTLLAKDTAHKTAFPVFTAGGGFAPYGAHGVFAALPLGVVFALNGFEQATQMSGEARNPQRNVPRAR